MEVIKIKKLIFTFLLIFSLFISMPLSSFSASRQTHSWYCMRKGNEQPILEPQMSFIEKYDGFYLDKRADEKNKVIYLTFDAGYENGNVAKILDTLEKHNAPGAFFILENLIKRDTELVKRMAKEGHLVCNHTASHKDMTTLCDRDSFAKELNDLEAVYKEYTGNEMAKFYRPPEGKFSEENMKFADELGYDTVFWSLAYADWDNQRQPDPENAKELILKNTHNGMVLLLHPTSATNAEILEGLLCEWEKQGYRFGDLNELCKR
ncbi:MAG: delta-lactam-biosynthetic de-N-acetylase [Ruminococcaceae bacterium]|nr:delta-lactam-biosynthetic de-N-acetylase [Oscillospiraceae bacterium]